MELREKKQRCVAVLLSTRIESGKKREENEALIDFYYLVWYKRS